METEELEDIAEVVDGGNNIENFDENKNFDRRESLYGLTRSRVCESCEKFEKCMPLGQSVRRCQACAKRKGLIEKKAFHNIQGEELISEERLEMDDDDEPLIVATSKFVIEGNMVLEEHHNTNTKISCNESFAVEHEHVNMHDIDVVKTSNSLSYEDGKGIKKKESILLNKKENKIANAIEPTLKKEKFGYCKGRTILEKDIPISNEKKEQVTEILDVQKTKEEIELERKERGWIVSGRIASHLKQMQVKNIATIDGNSPDKERKDKVKVKTLKEKPDTQRILGLVARRSESRITSPTHKRDPNKLKDDEIEFQHTTGMSNNAIPIIRSQEKSLEISKPHDVNYKNITHVNDGLTCSEDARKKLSIDVDEEVLKEQQCEIQQIDSKSKCSSPTNLSHYNNANLLFGTQHILKLFATRNGSRISSPVRSLETRIKEYELNHTKENELKENKIKRTNVVFHSSTLHDQKKDLPIEVILPQTSKMLYNDNDSFLWNNKKEKVLNSNPSHGMGLETQTYNTHQNMESNNTLSSNTNCHFNDNPLYGTHRILGLIAQRSESNMTSPKQCLDSSIKENTSIHVKNSGSLKLDDTMKTMSVAHPSCSKENEEVVPSQVAHFTLASHNHNNSSQKINEDAKEKTIHSNVEQNNLKLQPEQNLSRQNSTLSNFSTPSSTICHVNDNPLYGTKFESEPSNCTFNNVNEKYMCALNPTPIAHGLIGKPSNNPLQEASKICGKRESNLLLTKKLPVSNSSELTPLYKSAVATPICKSPEPNMKTNKTLCQVEPKIYVKEVEIVEEESFLASNYDVQLKNNIKINEVKAKRSNKKEEKHGLENNTLNSFDTKNLNNLENTKDKLMKKSNEEKESISHYNLKVTLCQNSSKSRTIFWPVHILFKILTYPFKLVLKLILYFVYILKYLAFGIIRSFKKLKNITFLGFDFVKSQILKHFKNGCNKSQGYSGCRCATKIYILIVLSSLLLPSFFDLDFYLVNRFIEGQVIIKEALNFDYTKEHPTAMVNLLPQQIIGKAKRYFPDREAMDAHAFPPSHIYHIIIHLTVPESQYNHEIGMFQVVAETFSARGHSLNKASRASMLRYHSSPVKYIKSLIMGIPIVLGLSQESQTLSIKVMESQNENEHSPTASIRVDIEPKAGHLTGLGVPEIYHGELQVIAHNPYLREVARNWVWSLYVYSGLALFFFEVLLVLCCCRRIFPQKLGNEDDTQEILTKENKPVLKEGPKLIQTSKRLHRRHIYFPKGLPLALPSTSNVIECKSI